MTLFLLNILITGFYNSAILTADVIYTLNDTLELSRISEISGSYGGAYEVYSLFGI
jgi:hypothetical protein